MTASTDRRPGTTALAALVLGIASALLITVVSFIALALAALALVTGGTALGRGEPKPAPVAGMLLALGAVVVFVLEVSG